MISHATADIELARKFSSAIALATFRALSPWFSSDQSGFGGMQAGEKWFARIVTELEQSDAVIILITPNSTDSSWVVFESGFAAGRQNVAVIPVLVGAAHEDVPPPLRHWQVFRADSLERCKELFSKLCTACNTKLEDEIVTPVLIDLAKNCADFSVEAPEKSTKQSADASDFEAGLERLHRFLDAKFFDIHRRIETRETNFAEYKITVQNEIANKSIEISIDLYTTVQDVLNAVYFSMDNHVKAYTYLETWILRDPNAEIDFVIRNFADEIPAHLVFNYNRRLTAEKLDQPYTAGEFERTRKKRF